MEFTGNVFGYASSVVRKVLLSIVLLLADSKSQWIDYFCSFMDSDLSWRVPLFIQCVIGVILAAGSLLMPESPRSAYLVTLYLTSLSTTRILRWLIDTDKDDEGLRVLIDLHGGDPNNEIANAEFQEIKDRVMFEVCLTAFKLLPILMLMQRESGEARSYAVMWQKYKRRVLLAMSSQAFAQLVSSLGLLPCPDVDTRRNAIQNGINGNALTFSMSVN